MYKTAQHSELWQAAHSAGRIIAADPSWASTVAIFKCRVVALNSPSLADPNLGKCKNTFAYLINEVESNDASGLDTR